MLRADIDEYMAGRVAPVEQALQQAAEERNLERADKEADPDGYLPRVRPLVERYGC